MDKNPSTKTRRRNPKIRLAHKQPIIIGPYLDHIRGARSTQRTHTNKNNSSLTYVVRVFLPFLPVQLQSTQQTNQHEVKRLAPQQPLQLMIRMQQLQPLISSLIIHFTQILGFDEAKLSQGRKILSQDRRRQLTAVLELCLLDTLARRSQYLDNRVEFSLVSAFLRRVAPLCNNSWSSYISMANIIMVVSTARILQNQ